MAEAEAIAVIAIEDNPKFCEGSIMALFSPDHEFGWGDLCNYFCIAISGLSQQIIDDINKRKLKIDLLAFMSEDFIPPIFAFSRMVFISL